MTTSTAPHSPSPNPSRRTRVIIVAALAIVTVGLLLKGLLTPTAQPTYKPGATPLPTAPTVGHLAPNITLRNLANQPVALSSLRGKVVALNFWYAACVACKAEMPALEHAYEKYQAQGFVVLGVDTVDDPETLDVFIHDLGITYPIVRDVDLRAATTYRITDTPSTFVIDRDGVVSYRIAGPMQPSMFTTAIPALLAQSQKT